ncbi:MAG: hypothetical protein AAB948_03225 [Patescibacteria group bacterium]
MNKKYIENTNPKTTSQKIGVKDIEPPINNRVRTKIAVYIARPANPLGTPNVLLYLLY